MASEPTPLGPREWTRCSDSVICEAWTFCKDHWIGAAGSALVGIITLASHPIYALVVGQEQAATDLPSILYFAIVAVVIGLSVFLIGIIVAPVRIRKRERIACDEAQRKLAEDTSGTVAALQDEIRHGRALLLQEPAVYGGIAGWWKEIEACEGRIERLVRQLSPPDAIAIRDMPEPEWPSKDKNILWRSDGAVVEEEDFQKYKIFQAKLIYAGAFLDRNDRGSRP
jgi:hypothetical protein